MVLPLLIAAGVGTALGLGSSLLANKSQEKSAKRGAEIQAAGYRQAAVAAGQSLAFNNQVDEINTERIVTALQQQVERLQSSQRVSAAASGFSSTSQSFLAIMDATLDQATTEIRQEVAAGINRRNASSFNTLTQIAALETQAEGAADLFELTKKSGVEKFFGAASAAATGASAGISLLGSLGG